MSRVFQNIDAPPLSPPSECVLPPHQRRGRGTLSPDGEGDGGSKFLKDERHRIGLLQYNLSTGYTILVSTMCVYEYTIIHSQKVTSLMEAVKNFFAERIPLWIPRVIKKPYPIFPSFRKNNGTEGGNQIKELASRWGIVLVSAGSGSIQHFN